MVGAVVILATVLALIVIWWPNNWIDKRIEKVRASGRVRVLAYLSSMTFRDFYLKSIINPRQFSEAISLINELFPEWNGVLPTNVFAPERIEVKFMNRSTEYVNWRKEGF